MDELKRLYIEPTTKCNLHCEMCFRNSWFDEKICDMSMEVFDKVIETIPKTVESIVFGGMGEPLFHPNIISMVSRCHGLGVRVEVLTNGTLLSKTMCHELINAGLNCIWISMDELEPGCDQGIGHLSYDNLTEKIKQFNFIRRTENPDAELGITFVATKSNVMQLSRLPFIIDQFMVNHVNVSNFSSPDLASMDEALYKRTLDLSVGSDVFGGSRATLNIPYMDFHLPQVQNTMVSLFQGMNFQLQVGGIKVPRRSHYCRFVQEGICFVRSDGNVTPCMALLHNGTTCLFDTQRVIHHHSFGSMIGGNLTTIWEDNNFFDFREKVRNFQFSPCTNCGQCSYPESNQEDCYGNVEPTCGACLWAEGIFSCP